MTSQGGNPPNRYLSGIRRLVQGNVVATLVVVVVALLVVGVPIVMLSGGDAAIPSAPPSQPTFTIPPTFARPAEGTSVQPTAVPISLPVGSIKKRVKPSSSTSFVAPDAGVVIVIPAAAVNTETTLSYEPVSASEIPDLPEGFTSVQQAFNLSPLSDSGERLDSLTFDKPISITFDIPSGLRGLGREDLPKMSVQH